MAIRRLSKRVIRLSEKHLRACRRWKGRHLLNASVPMAIESITGRSFFNTWCRLKLAMQGRRVRK